LILKRLISTAGFWRWLVSRGLERGPSTQTLVTGIDIDAPAERVWRVLTDFPAYPQWNPFMVAVSGKLKKRAALMVRVMPEGYPPVTFRPRVLHVAPNEELVWKGHAIVPGFFDGEHRFAIERLASGKSRLTHAEVFSGVLVPFFAPILLETTQRGFEAMNAALKRRAETLDL
jgi:hypothetical protein